MAKKPNIVIIECDSMDGRVMGCVGHLAAYTPNLDRLAERGMLFSNAYCNSPQCGPSRASRWSGLQIDRTGSWNNYQGLSEQDPTYMTHLENAGYRTQVFGKTDHLTGGHSLLSQVCAWTRTANIRLPQKASPTSPNRLIRLDEDMERVHERDWKFVDQSLAWLKEYASKSTPFLLNCSVNAPHPSFVSSTRWLRNIDLDQVTIPPFEKDLHPVMDYMVATKNCLQDFKDEEILSVRQTYFAMVSEVDAMVGQIIGNLEAMGLLENTYIIFTSDHGEMNMEHRQYLKNAMYEASARIPLIITGPGIEQGVEVKDLVSLIDFFPTILEMADLVPPKGLDGASLMPFLMGQTTAKRPPVLSQFHSNFANTGIFMLRDGPWKYIVYPGYEPQLFNVENDPDEIDNLAISKPEVVSNLDQLLMSLVDYAAVDARAKAYDMENFIRWQEELGQEGYQAAMRRVYKNWNDDYDMQIKAWMDKG